MTTVPCKVQDGWSTITSKPDRFLSRSKRQEWILSLLDCSTLTNIFTIQIYGSSKRTQKACRPYRSEGVLQTPVRTGYYATGGKISRRFTTLHYFENQQYQLQSTTGSRSFYKSNPVEFSLFFYLHVLQQQNGCGCGIIGLAFAGEIVEGKDFLQTRLSGEKRREPFFEFTAQCGGKFLSYSEW